MAGHGGTLASTTSVRDGASTPQCFQLTYQSLEGYANLLGRKVEKQAAIAEYQLQSCMFSTSLKRFRSRFHDSRGCGLVESLQRGAVVCPIEQTAFFYSINADPSLLLVVELIATFLSGSEEQCVVLGWAMLPVFHPRHHQLHVHRHLGKSSSSSTGVSPGSVRLSLYEGSPRALFSMQYPSPDSKELVPIPGCILTCSLCPYPTLGRAVHLFPSETIVSYDDIIPGLVPTRVPEAFPKLVRSTSATFEKVSLLLLPSVDDFEEQLLTLLLEDFSSHDSKNDSSTTIAIEERRMKISLYNGWQSIGSPAIGYLEKVSPSSSSASRGASLRSSVYGPRRNNLVLKGSLELSDIAPHPLVEVVLQLEYVVSWSGVSVAQSAPTTSRSRGNVNSKPPSNHSTTLTLGWGVWQPFDSDTPLDTGCQVSVDLKAGPGFRPTVLPSSAHTACYKGKLGDAGKVTFKFVPSKASNRADSNQLINSSVSNVQFEDFTPRETARDMPDSGITEGTRPPPVRVPPVTSIPSGQAWNSPEPEEIVPPPGPLPPPLEVKVSSSSHHSIPPSQSRPGTYCVSRSILAYLHSAGFEEFRDAKGNPLPSIDPPPAIGRSPLTVSSLQSPLPSDPLQDGPYQIAVQLMALTGGGELKSVVLSYRFFTFPPVTASCCLTKEGGGGGQEGKRRNLPLILQSSRDKTQFGLVHRFPITHLTLPGSTDRSEFASYLSSGRLHVDLYDGDSLILIGTTAIPLKGLLQPGKEHFQVTLSSPIEFPTNTLDTSVSTIAMDSLGAGAGSDGQGVVSGRLYLRLARVQVDNRDLTQTESPPKRTRSMVVARRLYGYGASGEGDTHRKPGDDEQTRKRKHARMRSVREMRQNQERQEQQSDLHIPPVFSRIPPLPSQSNIVDIQREELKRKTISSVLEDSLTSSYLIKPRMGQAVYFEHEFTNQRAHPLSVSVTWKDPDLRLVTDRRECHYLRQLYSIHTAIDDNLITESPEGGGEYTFFVHPSETVRLPFRYQSFKEHAQASTHTSGEGRSGNTIIKVYLQSSQRDLLAILNVHVKPQLHRVDRVLHFYHPERTFLKKHFLLPGNFLHHEADDILGDTPELFACSSEPNSTCEVRTTGGSSTVFIKAAVRESPSAHFFYIMLYSHRFLVSPTEVWQVVAHSVHRVDHSPVVGQTSGLRLTLRGNHTNRRIVCYSLTGPNVQVVTPSPFLLSAHSLSELRFSLKTLTIGSSHTVITATDMDSRLLVDAWLICTTAREPSISRAFQVALPSGGNTPTQKTITFTNPYTKQKEFSLATTHPNIITFSNSTIQLQPRETVVLALLFSPSPSELSVDALVFINDELDQTEECFLVKTIYS